MPIIPIIFFAIIGLFGLGLGGTSVTQEATPELSAPTPSEALVPGTTGEAPMSPKMVRSMFEHRNVLPSCGTIDADDRGESAWECLQAAADEIGPGAELARTGITDEGDPITTYLRVSFGAMEIYTDNSQDRFRGDPAWTFQICQVPDDVRAECTGS